MDILPAVVDRVVREALLEDLPSGRDLTGDLVVPADMVGSGTFQAKAPGVLCGVALLPVVFGALEAPVTLDAVLDDGARIEPGMAVARARGPVRALLAAERTALNLLCRLSGIATLTRTFVDRVAPLGVRVADTRKTTPGLRALERWAVRVGGGMNHRLSLSETIMIKDNHAVAAGGVRAALERALAGRPHTATIVCEVARLADVDAAVAGGADVVLLDNFSPGDVRRAVARARDGRPIFEASGGITLANAHEYAAAGAAVLSVGALTHSAPALDLSFELSGGP